MGAGMKKTDLSSFAELDFDRDQRCGFAEFIYGASKTPEQIAAIMSELAARGKPVLTTRISPEAAQYVLKKMPDAVYDELARSIMIPGRSGTKRSGKVAVICAGTSDLPVAKEAVNTLTVCGVENFLIPDCGVAGLHRLLSKLERLRKADIIIAVAGMEGALPSVTAGLVECPVIAVPTSVGYGASLNGITALLAMLNSYASGVTVVNIDNGFGAACAAVRMLALRK
ncbi:MAG: nickel pincer cofactor biosynthesis protein LarB [Lentisphaeria bacterium]|nr:nickel pincer cofactor biosynthesis protein LarB [Lentisphaeria bacterium]